MCAGGVSTFRGTCGAGSDGLTENNLGGFGDPADPSRRIRYKLDGVGLDLVVENTTEYRTGYTQPDPRTCAREWEPVAGGWYCFSTKERDPVRGKWKDLHPAAARQVMTVGECKAAARADADCRRPASVIHSNGRQCRCVKAGAKCRLRRSRGKRYARPQTSTRSRTHQYHSVCSTYLLPPVGNGCEGALGHINMLKGTAATLRFGIVRRDGALVDPADLTSVSISVFDIDAGAGGPATARSLSRWR